MENQPFVKDGNHDTQKAVQQVVDEILEMVEGIIKAYKGTSTHGTCCTCQDCKNHHDDCTCGDINTLSTLSTAIKRKYKK